MASALRRAGLKVTPQRLSIVTALAHDDTHPTAQELFERLRGSVPAVSFATVYNTLDALARVGLMSVLRLGGPARFDPNTQPHHHAVCDGCGAVVDLPVPSLAPSAEAEAVVRAAAPGFVVARDERTFRGLCARCHARQAETRPGEGRRTKSP